MSKVLFWSLVIIATGGMAIPIILVWLALRGIGVRPWR